MDSSPLEAGGKRYVLDVFQDGGDLEGYSSFVVEITPKYAFTLVERMNVLAAAQTKDPDANEIYYWDLSGAYFASSPEGLDGLLGRAIPRRLPPGGRPEGRRELDGLPEAGRP